jgi:hypothetical protein
MNGQILSLERPFPTLCGYHHRLKSFTTPRGSRDSVCQHLWKAITSTSRRAKLRPGADEHSSTDDGDVGTLELIPVFTAQSRPGEESSITEIRYGIQYCEHRANATSTRTRFGKTQPSRPPRNISVVLDSQCSPPTVSICTPITTLGGTRERPEPPMLSRPAISPMCTRDSRRERSLMLGFPGDQC